VSITPFKRGFKMNRISNDELNESLKQCGFSSLSEYEEFRNKVIQEAEMSIAKNKKNIFQKLLLWITSTRLS
jgi:hypothetical protein